MNFKLIAIDYCLEKNPRYTTVIIYSSIFEITGQITSN